MLSNYKFQYRPMVYGIDINNIGYFILAIAETSDQYYKICRISGTTISNVIFTHMISGLSAGN